MGGIKHLSTWRQHCWRQRAALQLWTPGARRATVSWTVCLRSSLQARCFTKPASASRAPSCTDQLVVQVAAPAVFVTFVGQARKSEDKNRNLSAFSSAASAEWPPAPALQRPWLI